MFRRGHILYVVWCSEVNSFLFYSLALNKMTGLKILWVFTWYLIVPQEKSKVIHQNQLKILVNSSFIAFSGKVNNFDYFLGHSCSELNYFTCSLIGHPVLEINLQNFALSINVEVKYYSKMNVQVYDSVEKQSFNFAVHRTLNFIYLVDNYHSVLNTSLLER